MQVSTAEKVKARLKAQVLRAREDPVEFTHFVGRVEGNRRTRVAPIHGEWQQFLKSNGKATLYAPVGHGKQLPVDTEIATPDGWVPIGELVPGDWVIGGDGRPTRVTWVSSVRVPPTAYELEFKDGARIVADADHQWLAWSRALRRHSSSPRTVTTLEIIQNLRSDNGKAFRWSIPLVEPVQYPERVLPLNPYVLGFWLGNGKSDSATISVNDQDQDILDLVREVFGPLGTTWRSYDHGCTHTTVLGLAAYLRTIGVLGNKHVPTDYLHGSVEQRRELLAGLMDSDGNVNRGRCRFVNTNRDLAQGVAEIVRSLGYLAYWQETRSIFKGVDHGPLYTVSWTSYVQVFKCKRKSEVLEQWIHANVGKKCSRSNRPLARTVVGWREVPPVPMCCIAVEADHHTYVATRDYIVTHNSNQITRWRVEWELGRNPNLRIALISSTNLLPSKMLGAVKGDIEGNAWLRMVFPKLRPSRGAQRAWSDSIIVDRDDVLPDPSVQTFGLYGKILGSRLDLIIIDDICNLENTLTPQSRDKMWDWISGEVLSRLPRTGGRVWAIGHVWHEDDVLHRLSRLPSFASKKYAATIRDENGVEVPLIPEMWTVAGIRQRAADLGIYAKMMLWNELISAREGRIRRAWFEKCLQRGRGYGFLESWNPADAPAYTGVDLGVDEEGAVTCLFTVCVLPDGSRRILDIRSGHWTAPDILRQIEDVHRRFGSIIAVENNGAQEFLLQFASELSCLPIKGHHTGMNKHHPQYGVESFGLELEQGKWIIPCDNVLVPTQEVAEWIRETVAYSPDRHMGDRLAASWICREAIRLSPAAGLTQDRLSDIYNNIDAFYR